MTVREPQTPQELESYFDLRYRILRKPWDQPKGSEKDDSEKISTHLFIPDENGEAIACGRFYFNSETESQIRSMAVDDAHQNKGLGKLILDACERLAKDNGATLMVLDARAPAADFYQKHGYVITADSYLLFGVIPHFRMQKKL